METKAPALPVPPLTEEQKADLFKVCGEFYSDGRRMNLGASDSRWRRYRERATPEVVLALLAEAQMRTEPFTQAMAYARGQEEENARLSRLLEEERRTVAELQERNAMLGGSLDDERRDTAELVKEFGELRGKVTSLLEDFANGCGLTSLKDDYWQGVNSERARNLAWAELKCKELGIEWPIKPIPYKGNLPEPAPTCQRDCQKCEKAESRTGSELLDLMLCPSQQPNPHKDPNFLGCWGNAECPCDSKHPEDCPLYTPPEPEAAAGGAGVGLQGEEGGGRE